MLDNFFSAIESTFEWGFDTIDNLFRSTSKGSQSFDASFGAETTVLNRYNKGITVTGIRKLSLSDSYQNAIFAGGPGTGKSSTVAIGTALTAEGSKIISDPANEIVMTAGYLHSQGYKILRLNFSDPSVSAGYNPIARAETSSQIQRVATMLVESSLGGNKADKFWNSQAVNLISMLITILKTQPAEYQNLYNVRMLCNKLSSDKNGIDELFKRFASDELFSEFVSFVGGADNTVAGIIASAKSCLQVFTDHNVAKVTSHDSIDFDSFRNEKVCLYINNPVGDQKYLNVLVSVFFEQLFSHLLAKPIDRNLRPIHFILDEIATLRIPSLPQALATLRKTNCSISLLVQNFAQLKHNYGEEAQSILACCFTRMTFTGATLETCKELEALLGRHEVIDKDGKKQTLPLMTAESIRTMPKDRALVICGYHKPILAKLKPYYKRADFKRYCEMPLPPIETQFSPGPVPLLPLDFPANNEQAA
jgi:type IV secretion system protein VirD4